MEFSQSLAPKTEFAFNKLLKAIHPQDPLRFVLNQPSLRLALASKEQSVRDQEISRLSGDFTPPVFRPTRSFVALALAKCPQADIGQDRTEAALEVATEAYRVFLKVKDYFEERKTDPSLKSFYTSSADLFAAVKALNTAIVSGDSKASTESAKMMSQEFAQCEGNLTKYFKANPDIIRPHSLINELGVSFSTVRRHFWNNAQTRLFAECFRSLSKALEQYRGVCEAIGLRDSSDF